MRLDHEQLDAAVGRRRRRVVLAVLAAGVATTVVLRRRRARADGPQWIAAVPTWPSTPDPTVDARTVEAPTVDAPAPGADTPASVVEVTPLVAAVPEPVAEVAAQSGPYPGSVLPAPDGSAPVAGYTFKGNASSMLCHGPDSPYYVRTRAEVWFRTVEDAEAAGFRRYSR